MDLSPTHLRVAYDWRNSVSTIRIARRSGGGGCGSYRRPVRRSSPVSLHLRFVSAAGAVRSDGAAEAPTRNVNQDYFVARRCSSGRYGLLGCGRNAGGVSPACRYLHPIYAGYETPLPGRSVGGEPNPAAAILRSLGVAGETDAPPLPAP